MTRSTRARKFYELLTDREVEAEYKIPRATQKKWRRMKYQNLPGFNGFPFLKIGKIVRYRRSEIEEWLEAQRMASDHSRRSAESPPVNDKLGQLNLF